VAYFKTLSQHLPEGTEDNQEDLTQEGRPRNRNVSSSGARFRSRCDTFLYSHTAVVNIHTM